jgi:hypothetical protein
MYHFPITIKLKVCFLFSYNDLCCQAIKQHAQEVEDVVGGLWICANTFVHMNFCKGEVTIEEYEHHEALAMGTFLAL